MSEQAYGLWPLVILNSGIFIIFAFSFFKPKTSRDWRTFGGFAAFIVALFTEMYGFPLTIFLLSGWLQSRYPAVDLFAHNNGHLWHTLFRLKGDPHWDVFHLASYVFIFAGFSLLSYAWDVLYKAQKAGTLAVGGPYSSIRHPQYVGFVLIMFGFIVQWPTFITLLMFPVLLVMYWRLSLHEESEMHTEFGDVYDRYAAVTPRFIPRFGQKKLAPADR